MMSSQCDMYVTVGSCEVSYSVPYHPGPLFHRDITRFRKFSNGQFWPPRVSDRAKTVEEHAARPASILP